MTSNRAILQFAVAVGEVLLQNGAEIRRVEETIQRVLEAFGIRDHSVYVLSNGVFATLEGEEGGENHGTALRNVPVSALHLGRIAAVNELSRAIERSPDPARLEEYRVRLRACAETPHFPVWQRALAGGAGSGGFCFLLGGQPADCVGAFLCGCALLLFLTFYGRKKRSRFTHTLLGAALVSFLAMGMAAVAPGLSPDHVIIGAIISLVPGVALTTSIRDFFNGDFLSGVIRLVDTALTGVCIAVGVGVALQCWRFIAGGGF